MPKRALELLRLGTNNERAEFREGQEEAITHVVEGRGRLLVVQKTGWGKSSVYFIATKLLREEGKGPALLVSPLLSLMRNQIVQSERMGVRAITINSDNQERWAENETAITNNAADIILISPERFANEHFITQVLAKISATISLLVIDEAHCISDWGHDFRPHYRLIERIIQNLPPNLRLLGTTATANNRVLVDLEKTLGPKLTVFRGDLNRPSLRLQTIKLPNQAERLAWLAKIVPAIKGNGIIYTLTVHDSKRVAAWLQWCGINAESYTSETENREEFEAALLENKVKALVATTALGMCFDKPDLSFVIHYQTPGSVVAYYQQVGRAGRAIGLAYGILLSGREDTEITNYFIETAFPTKKQVELILNELQHAPDGLSVPQLLYKINVSKGQAEKTLSLLSLESPAPIVKQGTKWQLTPSKLSQEFWERAARLKILRYQERDQMQEYVNLTSGHMEYLIQALDGDPGTVRPPANPPLPVDIDPDLVRAAVVFLRRTSRPVVPRKMWPPLGGLPHLGVNGKIKPERQAQEGRVLCLWGDSGCGELVRQGKYINKHYSDELVKALKELVDEWKIDPAPTWVTCIPSLRHPELVPDFAKRLAGALNLPFYAALRKTDARRPQKEMENSSQQALNVDGSLEVDVEGIPQGSVLLVDDMVDSRWTLTVAAYLLQSNGSGKVYPLALADTGHGNE
ncbi:MAG: RecQ family ATP-dependent DNA helicase [Dehalococcoidales bacterium]|nr:RecQ family ATP-dependent DNA helicase [Dehalococcoidales bacterium]